MSAIFFFDNCCTKFDATISIVSCMSAISSALLTSDEAQKKAELARLEEEKKRHAEEQERKRREEEAIAKATGRETNALRW